MHIARVHTKTIISPGGPRGPRKPVMALDDEHVHSNGNGKAVEVVELPATRRRTHGPNLVPRVGKFEVNGCPNCLFPLRIMNDALDAQGIPLPPFCPQCTMPVDIIRSSMSVTNKHKTKQLV